MSSGWVISPAQRPLPDNTQHSQQTSIHAPDGVRPRNRSKRVAADHASDRQATGTDWKYAPAKTGRDPQTACLTQEGLTAILQEFMSLRGPACEARDESRREKEKLINKLECKFMSCDSICIHRCVRRGVYSPALSWSPKLTLIFEITKYKLRSL